jgi:hypothetical protein
MKPIINLEEQPGKTVGRRHAPTNPLALTASDQIADARAWQKAMRGTGIPKGVYRFRTHEEADEWLWKMITRRR